MGCISISIYDMMTVGLDRVVVRKRGRGARGEGKGRRKMRHDEDANSTQLAQCVHLKEMPSGGTPSFARGPGPCFLK